MLNVVRFISWHVLLFPESHSHNIRDYILKNGILNPYLYIPFPPAVPDLLFLYSLEERKGIRNQQKK